MFFFTCEIKKTETGSVSGPVLFTSCEMVYLANPALYTCKHYYR